MEPHDVVVVGAGQAAVEFAAALREGGFAGAVTLLGEEVHAPYERPPLSKTHLAREVAGPTPLRPPTFFDDQGVLHRNGSRVAEIDLAERSVVLEDGGRVPWGTLVLATGSAHRRLSVEGADLDGVEDLRTVDDAARVRARLDRARAVVVVGGGILGVEVATAVLGHGLDVTLLARGERLLTRTTSAPVAEVLRRRHEAMGLRVETGVGVSRLEGVAGEVTAVVDAAGQRHPADVVVTAIGAVPRTGLAAAAGLEVADGIVVDGSLRTSVPDVHAIGDCAQVEGGTRVETVQNAVDQAQHLAAVLLGTRDSAYAGVPWFASDQGTSRLQTVGVVTPGASPVWRGSATDPSFSVFSFADGRLVAVESVDAGRDHAIARRLLAAGVAVEPAQAADPGFDLRSLLRR